MKRRLHLHTDCAFFAGCESMLGVLLADPGLREGWELSFSYRRTPEYEKGLAERIPAPPAPQPLSLPGVDSWRKPWSALSRLLLAPQAAVLWDYGRLRSLFGRLRPAVVHINNGGWPGAASCRAAAPAAKAAGARVVCVVNNIASGYRAPRRWPDWPLDLAAARAVDRWVTADSSAKAALAGALRLEPSRVLVIPNGIPPRAPGLARGPARERLGIPPGRTALASVALFEARKGHALLFAALRGLPAGERPLVLVEGDGPGRAGLEGAARGLGDCVRFVGRERNIFDLLAACDGLVEVSVAGSPSPNVVAEAMGRGLAVLASVHSSREQVQDGEDGLLADPRDAAALGAALARLNSDAGLRERLGLAARESFRLKFSPGAAAARYAALYEELAGAPPGQLI